MFGYPILYKLIGDKATIYITIVILIFTLILSPIIILILELLRGKEHQNIFKGLIKSPIILAAFFGILFSIFDIKFPAFLDNYLHKLTISLIPVALFSVGLDINQFRFTGQIKNTIIISLLCTVVKPLIAIAICLLLNLSPLYAVALVILTAAPTAKSVYIYAAQYNFNKEESAAIISLSTLFSIITIPIVLHITKYFWPSIF